MTTKIFQELREEIHLSMTEKGHPFRYFTLGTVGLDKMARLRTIVLRNVSDALHLTFYTDKRSKKIIHITENNKVCLLFFYPQKMIQLKVEGLATIIKDPQTLENHWNNLKEDSKKDYTTVSAPGSSISSYEPMGYLREDNYFCMVHIEPHKIEYLKLEKPNHIRIRYSRDDEKWKGEYIVP